MTYSTPEKGSSGTVLVVILHSWHRGPEVMSDVSEAVREAYDGRVEICAPKLPHSRFLGSVRAAEIVRQTVEIVDGCVARNRSITRIVLIGHSFGATLARRVFLVASGAPQNFAAEEPLAGIARKPWADKIERIVLLAAFNRGWKISDRLSWYYSFMFNVAGLAGSIIPRWSPTIFDIRLGAPFAVQTRLNWLAYRRAQQGPTNTAAKGGQHRPILLQLIGTRDDLVSPFDQVDIAVDGSGGSGGSPSPDRDYYLIEVPQSDHHTILKLSGDANASRRRDLLMRALKENRDGLHEIATDPALLEDEVPAIDLSVKETVFVMHGIRDDGFWTHRIAEHVRMAGPRKEGEYAFRGWTPTYGYFAMLAFVLPWVRREKVEWFMDQYVSAFAQYPKSDFHFVGHSNGTYLAASGFRNYPAFHLRNVFFAGSVVRSDFPWAELIDQGRVQRFQNIVASTDKIVALLPKSVEWAKAFDLGGAGFDGFADAGAGGQITELKYVKGGHSAGITEEHWKQIAEFIVRGTAVSQLPGQARLYAQRQPAWLTTLSNLYFGIPGIVLVFFLAAPMAILFLPIYLGGSSWVGFNAWRVVACLAYLTLLRFVVTRL
jgi:pimeloyl-ACP methyl ester carboxylesterase